MHIASYSRKIARRVLSLIFYLYGDLSALGNIWVHTFSHLTQLSAFVLRHVFNLRLSLNTLG